MLKRFQSKLLIHKTMLKNLQSKLLTLLVLSTVLPVSAVGIYSISSSTKALTDLNIKQTENEVIQQSFRIDHFFEDAHDDVLMLSQIAPVQAVIRSQNSFTSPSLPDSLIARSRRFFDSFIATKHQYLAIQLFDNQGNLLVQVDQKMAPERVMLLHNDSLRKKLLNQTRSLKPQQIYTSPIQLEPIDPTNSENSSPIAATQPVIYYTIPLYNDLDQQRGVLIVTLSVKEIVKHANLNFDQQDTRLMLTTQNGDYLAHTNPQRVAQQLGDRATQLSADYAPEILQRMRNQEVGSIQVGRDRIISYQAINPNQNHEMLLVYDLPTYTVLGSVSQMKRISLGVVILSLGAALAIGASIVKRISRSQAALYQQAQIAAIAAEDKAKELQQTLHELRQTQTQLVQTEKMSSLGQLVAGVAHEINNPVNFIYGNLNHVNNYSQDLLHLIQLYQQHYPHPHPDIQAEVDDIDLDFLIADMPKMLDSMKLGSDRIRQIVLSLRNFSRIDEAEMKAVDIHEGIDSTLLILQNRTKAHGTFPGVTIEKAYGQLPLVECYAGQLNQVFMNILSNAIDALEETVPQHRKPAGWQPMLTIATQSSEMPGSNRDRPVAAVQIRIQDNGLGIPEAVRDRLFEPFFTTKPIGKGTGLGLSISYQIITERHNGILECLSEEGEGTEFRITIPLHPIVQTDSKALAAQHSIAAIVG